MIAAAPTGRLSRLFLAAKQLCSAHDANYKQCDSRWLGNGAELERIDRGCLAGRGPVEGDRFAAGVGGECSDHVLPDAAVCVRCVVVEGDGISGSGGGEETRAGVARSIYPPLEFVLLASNQAAHHERERVVGVGRNGGAEKSLIIRAEVAERRAG